MSIIKSKSQKSFKKSEDDSMPSLAVAYSTQKASMKKMASGGQVKMPDDSDEHYASIAEAILHKKRMASGGMVDLEENAMESGSTPYDTMNGDAAEDPIYDLDQVSDQPEDSNLMGDPEEEKESKTGLIGSIRSKFKSKS